MGNEMFRRMAPEAGCVMPKVSVVMAVYNGVRFVRDAVASILGQTFADFEFIVINDGSTDATRDVVSSFADPRIRIIDNDGNLGQTRSLNRGLQAARGELIARQDADDVSEPERLRRQVMFMDQHPQTALLGSWYTKMDAAGNPTGQRALPCGAIDIRWRLLFHSPFVHSSVMWRRLAVRDTVGLYNEDFTYAQDFELWCRVARSLPVANVPEHLVRIRTSPWSMTATYGDRVQEGHRLRLRNACELLGWLPNDGADRRFRSMAAMLFPTNGVVAPAEFRRSASDVLRLQSAFSVHYNLTAGDAATHRRRLRTDLVGRCIELAYQAYSRGARRDALRLVLQAMRLAPLQTSKRISSRATRMARRISECR
jgi:hypothetical protein